MMLWTLLLIANMSGAFTTDFKSIQIPMATKDACIAAGKELLIGSKGVFISCIGSEKGEFIKVEK